MAEVKLDKTEPIYTLSVAARLSCTPQHSIRQYIDKGLIIPFRTETNRHLFSEVDISRLICIRGYLKQGLNIAGIKALFSLVPCWALKPCKVEDRENCEAYHSSSYPCWEATSKGSGCKNTDCRICNVYQFSGNDMEIKSLLKEMLP
ncbi:MAG: MerR family transcriptional regulator [Bacteroidetes bacterium]|nr:MerR family transcriptional regulator [Bacteroidota bacterium]